MKIIIDADGCPVVDIIVKIAQDRNIKVIIVSDTSHIFDYDDVETIVVSKGSNSADFSIVNKLYENDIVITQDYGLAAMCLAKKAIPINQNGFIYSNSNIDNLLYKRHISKKIRKAGGKMTSMKKRTKKDNEKFIRCLLPVIDHIIS